MSAAEIRPPADAVAIVAAIVVFVALEWTRFDLEESPIQKRRAIALFGSVMLVMTLYCSVIAYVSSRAYLDWHRGSTRPLYALLLAAVAYGESSAKDVYEEMAGIASVLVRQSDDRDQELETLLGPKGTFAFAASDGNPRTAAFRKASPHDIPGANH